MTERRALTNAGAFWVLLAVPFLVIGGIVAGALWCTPLRWVGVALLVGAIGWAVLLGVILDLKYADIDPPEGR